MNELNARVLEKALKSLCLSPADLITVLQEIDLDRVTDVAIKYFAVLGRQASEDDFWDAFDDEWSDVSESEMLVATAIATSAMDVAMSVTLADMVPAGHA
jgi:hypothetical protein